MKTKRGVFLFFKKIFQMEIFQKPLLFFPNSADFPAAIDQYFFQKIEKIMAAEIQSGVLRAESADTMQMNRQNWQYYFDKNFEILGFFQLKFPRKNWLEMGSVKSLQAGLGGKMMVDFQRIKTQIGVKNAFAITKDWRTATKFFAAKTGGAILPFPSWFEREREDRYFIHWK